MLFDCMNTEQHRDSSTVCLQTFAAPGRISCLFDLARTSVLCGSPRCQVLYEGNNSRRSSGEESTPQFGRSPSILVFQHLTEQKVAAKTSVICGASDQTSKFNKSVRLQSNTVDDREDSCNHGNMNIILANVRRSQMNVQCIYMFILNEQVSGVRREEEEDVFMSPFGSLWFVAAPRS